jgi:Protein of unknown function (DUF2971)
LLTAERQAKAQDLKEYRYEEIERMTQELVDYLGILSLSTKRDSILMWSHYANGHKGFCLEFDAEKEPFRAARAVRYLRDRRSYRPFATSDKENAENLVLAKYQDWDYEAEWRIVIPKGRETYSFAPEALTGVIFGYLTSDGDKAKVKDWINRGRCHPVIYQARRSTSEFGLDIEVESGD